MSASFAQLSYAWLATLDSSRSTSSVKLQCSGAVIGEKFTLGGVFHLLSPLFARFTSSYRAQHPSPWAHCRRRSKRSNSPW
jgi:hypothetical protein